MQASLLGVPQESSLFDLWGAGGAGMSIFYGILWGVGGLTFGLSMRLSLIHIYITQFGVHFHDSGSGGQTEYFCFRPSETCQLERSLFDAFCQS